MHECLALTRYVLLGVTLGCGLGCRDALPRQRTYPVTGKVTLDGKPVLGATVVFHPLDNSTFKWSEVPQGTTDASGAFSIFTYASDDGAPTGDYKVGIAVLHPPAEDGDDQVQRLPRVASIPITYANAQTSGLTATVEAKATVLSPFTLSSQ